MKRLVAIAILVSLTTTFAAAQVGGGSTPRSDNRVRDALNSAGINFKIDSDGDFKMEEKAGGGRTQLVWARSKTMTYDMFEVREVFGVAWKGKNAPDSDVMLDLMIKNGTRKIGGWQIEKWGDEYVIIFSVRVGATADGDQLKSVVQAVVTETDKLEQTLTDGKDDY